ncbi:SDR family oxidoreductase [Oscillatoria sp. FACHB-1407]|uniref:SDR family NAD(P)-dependent oxidoreductase n=1 Tax=Oscillatoria sp. FACHB-1407 TaxID=2692847 RepID=UPI0016828AB4|nr:SDR family oxidoreductase [Oscillatoria sp. FACHB-1407]MBD2459932.1 SDR family oxidoreductase [Oscillatoria sp. FACHB-1407]
MSHPLTEQVILITGASTGIGAALARLLAHRYSGIRLALAARNTQKLDEVAQACRQFGADVLAVPTDMSQPEQVTALSQAVLERFGRVDALVNNAGYGQMGAVELIATDRVQNQFAVNVIGAIALIQSLIPGMRAQGGGRIVNISSLGGRMAFPFGGLYSASKFALEGLSDALRMELAPFNIRVVVVEPGPVRTEFFDVVKQGVDAMEVDPLNTPYRAAYENLEGLQQQVDRQAWSSERVAEVIVRALSDRRPHPRYIAATGGNILIFLMTKLLPTRMTDLFWQRFYAIHRVAQDWKYHKQA